MLTLEQQKQVIAVYKQYQTTDRNIIRANIKYYINASGLRLPYLADQIGIALQTIYAITKLTSSYKPDFITTLTICDFLKIPITAVIQPIPGLSITEQPEMNTKWNITAKQNFCRDYNRLDITALCQKYNITPRTAQEYNRIFSESL